MNKSTIFSRGVALAACLGMVLPAQGTEVASMSQKAARPSASQAPSSASVVEDSELIAAVLDVRLNDAGLLIGQVVDRSGQARADAEVVIRRDGETLGATRTDKNGRFAVKGMRGGAYELLTADSALPVRVWTEKAAPPHAVPGALLVEGEAMRGQGCSTCGVSSCSGGCGGHRGWGHSGRGGSGRGLGGRGLGGGRGGLLANPLVIGGAVAAAIAIPIALDDDDAS